MINLLGNELFNSTGKTIDEIIKNNKINKSDRLTNAIENNNDKLNNIQNNSLNNFGKLRKEIQSYIEKFDDFRCILINTLNLVPIISNNVYKTTDNKKMSKFDIEIETEIDNIISLKRKIEIIILQLSNL